MQNPGILSTLSFGGIGREEERIIRQFARVWFVSFARKATFKNSEYTFFFVKPTDKLINDFHLGREVLVVLTPYPQFEPRTLDFVDKTMFEFLNRLDKLCVVLISPDTTIRTKVKDIISQDRESRLIIPYSYYEFDASQNAESTIIKRLKEVFYERDLFAFDSPLRNDTYFFGRSQIIQELYGKYKSGQNGCLFGLRKIGKTSVLFAVQRHMSMRDEPSVYVDCSETSFHLRRWNESLYFLVSTFVRRNELPCITKMHKESEYTEKDASRCFEDDLLLISKHLSNQRLLFILDEVENITFDISPSDHWSNGKDYIFFWQSIRSVFQNNSNLFSFIMAGVNPKALEIPTVQGFDNPIYRLITPVYLPLFDIQEVREMVSSIGSYMGLQFGDEVFTYLTDDFGGHPFLIRQVCSRIHRAAGHQRPISISKFRYQADREKLTESIQEYIGLIVSVLSEKYKDEYELLEYLAQGDQQTFRDFVDLSYGMIEHLEGYGVIKEDAKQYHFRIKAVEDFVKAQSRIEKALLTKEEKWQEIGNQRNKLETNLRKLVRQTLKIHFGPVKAKETFLEVITPPERKCKLNSLNIEEIFDSEIYFNDLRQLIIKNWPVFGMIFNNDLERFKEYSEYVNRHRADAHANDIDEESMGIIKISMQWLQSRVNEFLK